MKAIIRKRNGYSALLAVCVLLTAYFFVKLITMTAFIFAVVSMALLMLLIKQNRLVFDARLIWNNHILVVPSAVIYLPDDKERKNTEETIVSTFGILTGSKIYKWGSDGVHGMRLCAIKIDQAWIYLTFGNGAKTIRVELLHGLVDEQTVLAVKQRFWRETGVVAVISGW